MVTTNSPQPVYEHFKYPLKVIKLSSNYSDSLFPVNPCPSTPQTWNLLTVCALHHVCFPVLDVCCIPDHWQPDSHLLPVWFLAFLRWNVKSLICRRSLPACKNKQLCGSRAPWACWYKSVLKRNSWSLCPDFKHFTIRCCFGYKPEE